MVDEAQGGKGLETGECSGDEEEGWEDELETEDRVTASTPAKLTRGPSWQDSPVLPQGLKKEEEEQKIRYI